MEVMAAGLLESTPDDVVDKISRDFTERGIHITRGEILVQVSKKHRLVAAIRVGVPTNTSKTRSAQDDRPQKRS